MGMVEKDNGALWIKLKAYKHGKAVIRKRGVQACRLQARPWNGTLCHITPEATPMMHGRMRKNQGKHKAIEDRRYALLEVGITSVKIQDMVAKRSINYTFNWDRMFSFEGDTGP
ncbi:uncharacterized protein BXZ73DRAFT_103876 [Epithele typhae]|uniref:uncharacterized protein n=1 Tax=Epithele typhae TaxID=378194 RepID=UPI002007A318|nr:uncharacterized protein BXZ73DRAFT_103876 [Epithele typhae]KAH9923438.1 hypothetical protein BXZ73DRAFT_103876 [Epithele typhae]